MKKLPKAIERAHLEEPRNPSLCGGAVEQNRRLWRGHPSDLVDQRPDFRIVEHILRDDQLARLDPGDIGQKPRRAAFP